MRFQVKHPAPTFPEATVERVMTTLVTAYDGLEIPGQVRFSSRVDIPEVLRLTSTDRIAVDGAEADTRIPLLSWSPKGRAIGIATSSWDRWLQQVQVEIPAELKIHGNRADYGLRQVWQAIDRLVELASEVRGLPIDHEGKLVRYSPATARLIDEEKLSELVNRGGPYLADVRLQDQDGGYFRLDLTFRCEFIVNFDRRDLPRAKVVAVGVINRPPGDDVDADTRPTEEQIDAMGQFGSQDPDLRELGRPVRRVFPPLVSTEHVEGSDPATSLASVLVVPYTASLSVGSPSQQLQAQAYWLDGHTSDLTDSATWLSSDPTKATVSAAGLVTRVAAGTTNVTCSYLGITSNACAVTVS